MQQHIRIRHHNQADILNINPLRQQLRPNQNVNITPLKRRQNLLKIIPLPHALLVKPRHPSLWKQLTQFLGQLLRARPLQLQILRTTGHTFRWYRLLKPTITASLIVRTLIIGHRNIAMLALRCQPTIPTLNIRHIPLSIVIHHHLLLHIHRLLNGHPHRLGKQRIHLTRFFQLADIQIHQLSWFSAIVLLRDFGNYHTMLLHGKLHFIAWRGRTQQNIGSMILGQLKRRIPTVIKWLFIKLLIR